LKPIRASFIFASLLPISPGMVLLFSIAEIEMVKKEISENASLLVKRRLILRKRELQYLQL
jgi:hypothetical protein